MKIQTFSVVIGTPACDASCPFCISRITGYESLGPTPSINFRNFGKACSLAKMGGCTTALFTGKGEPTLYPEELSAYLLELDRIGNPFPFIELQTNGLQIGYLARMLHGPLAVNSPLVPQYQQLASNDLRDWHRLGLNTIALSVVGTDLEHNRRIYKEDYPDLATTVAYLHNLGYAVRLCVMMQRGMVDTIEKVIGIAEWCKVNKVAQLTVRPIRAPESPTTDPTKEELYIQENGIPQGAEEAIRDEIALRATHILTLMHGAHAAKVYDYKGQNICVSDCLTMEPQSDDIRTLIFYSNGKLTYSWQHDGARLL